MKKFEVILEAETVITPYSHHSIKYEGTISPINQELVLSQIDDRLVLSNDRVHFMIKTIINDTFSDVVGHEFDDDAIIDSVTNYIKENVK